MKKTVFELPPAFLERAGGAGAPRSQHTTWFSRLFGFHESKQDLGVEATPNWVRSQVKFDEAEMTLTCPNGKVYACGTFATPSVSDLRQRLQSSASASASASASSASASSATFTNIVADVRTLLHDPSNSNAVFQAASQFNCLEMVHSHVSPEEGIESYAADRTQGPICAVACAAGTFYRNYLVRLPVPVQDGAQDPTAAAAAGAERARRQRQGPRGQSRDGQINTMCDVEAIVDNARHNYWHVRNGYLLPVDDSSLEKLRLSNVLSEKREACVSAVRVGVQYDTQVTSEGPGHTVTQVYASAVPVGYDKVTPPVTSSGMRRNELWEPLAQLVLEATYEACLAIAALQSVATGKRVTCYLTKVGGGVFQNDDRWIVAAIQRALGIHKHAAVDVKCVHYGSLQTEYNCIEVR